MDFKDFKPEVREKGRAPDGAATYSGRRLYMQILVYEDLDEAEAIEFLGKADFESVLYRDMNHPMQHALLTYAEEPEFFSNDLRYFLNNSCFSDAVVNPEFTMIGRTYTIGYEQDLENVLVHRNKKRVQNKEWPWAIWYPLRRRASFYRLDPAERTKILAEHGNIGAAYGAENLASDIRLASFGLDANDNDFVIGLLGEQLTPLSQVVHTMRSTIQTSEYIEKLGPFFVGQTIFQSEAE